MTSVIDEPAGLILIAILRRHFEGPGQPKAAEYEHLSPTDPVVLNTSTRLDFRLSPVSLHVTTPWPG